MRIYAHVHIYTAISDSLFMLTKDQEGCNDPINPLSPHHGAWPIVAQEALRSTMKETDAPHLWSIFCKSSINHQPFRLLVCFSFAISVCSNSYRGAKHFYCFRGKTNSEDNVSLQLRDSCLFQNQTEHFLRTRMILTKCLCSKQAKWNWCLQIHCISKINFCGRDKGLASNLQMFRQVAWCLCMLSRHDHWLGTCR